MDQSLNQQENFELPYFKTCNRYELYGRVIYKSPIRNNSKNYFFNFGLMTEYGKLYATASTVGMSTDQFNYFFNMFEPGRVYRILQFNSFNMEISDTKYSIFKAYIDILRDTVVLPSEEYMPGIIPISNIATFNIGTFVDLTGTCTEIQEGILEGQSYKKRDIVLIDESHCSVNLTLWGRAAVNFPEGGHPVVLVKRALVGVFDGIKGVHVEDDSAIKVNSDISELQILQNSQNFKIPRPLSCNLYEFVAKVISKGSFRYWHNNRMKLFEIGLMNVFGHEIGAIPSTLRMSHTQCENLFNLIERERSYRFIQFEPFDLVEANRKYSSLKNDRCINLWKHTIVVPFEGDIKIKEQMWDPTPISDIVNLLELTVVDLIGICIEKGEISVVHHEEEDKRYHRCDIVLIDQSDSSVNLTLWRDDAVNFSAEGYPVVLLKRAQVGVFDGIKGLNLKDTSVMELNPDILECHNLRTWFDKRVGKQHLQ